MIGQTIAHYKILEKLGEGGMGVVYKALDTKLDRTVALKFLPASALGEDEKKRFVQEARAAAALDHPNICTIYEINESKGETFIAMAYINGKSLRDRVDEGPFKVETALDVAIQIAEGLEAAHDEGIVHRDIKSANIMFTDRGRAQIMDFGLARPIEEPPDGKERSTMGTVAYMSPEQTRGDAVDGRTDIWSLGIVMYEMLAGKRPFRGTYEQSVIYSIVNEDPEPVTAMRTGIPAEFEAIIARALAKKCKNRYANTGDLLTDLRDLKRRLDSAEIISQSGVRAAPKRSRLRSVMVPSLVFAAIVVFIAGYFMKYVQKEAEGAQIPIAVADFANETTEKELDGLSGMLITSLEQSRRLSVYTRSSMFDVLKKMGQDAADAIDERLGREICVQANINVLIVPTIRKFDDLYTIDVKAYEMGRSEHLFTAKEGGQGKASIPGMIDRIAERTRKGFNENSFEIRASNDKVADVTTPNLEAYQHYFRGEQLVNDLKFEEAQEAFHAAIELDSTFALTQYRLAYANWWGGESEAIQKDQLQKAVALKHRLPEKYRFLLNAQEAVNEDGYPAGIVVLKEMERLYPGDKEMIYNIGDFSFHADEHEQATEYLEKALEMDPKFERALNHLTMTYSAMKNPDKAVEIGRRYVEVTNSPQAFRLLSNAHLIAGDKQGALKTAQRAGELMPEDPMVTHQIATVQCMNDQFDIAVQILDSMVVVAKLPKIKRLGYSSLVGANLYMGRYRDALASADKKVAMALEEGDLISAVSELQHKGIVYSWGWGDHEKADAEFARARELMAGIGLDNVDSKARNDYWENDAIHQLLTGRVDQARETARGRAAEDPGLVDRVRFFVHWRNHEYDRAQEVADSLLATGEAGMKTMMLYYLAQSQMDHGRFDEALASLEELQQTIHYSGPRPIFYAPSYYLMAQSLEKKGDTKAAIANYGKFLDMWRNADTDLPLLQKAKLRLAELTDSSTQ